ncbi:hypothetical protein EV182_005665 [Spiromyces aspiralis]|uniref:Uncharacterized protein n=1 Tax=Spiromyces aspiralis TaxID=68401 RepID=A0ACC1H9P4_9FUNG|nr:hypothetical protein EV182_005665 [Spiromyces aspiralis]
MTGTASNDGGAGDGQSGASDAVAQNTNIAHAKLLREKVSLPPVSVSKSADVITPTRSMSLGPPSAIPAIKTTTSHPCSNCDGTLFTAFPILSTARALPPQSLIDSDDVGLAHSTSYLLICQHCKRAKDVPTVV